MREHDFELVEQPWRTVVRVHLPDPADRALQLFLNESRHRRTLELLEEVLSGRAPQASGGSDRMSFHAGPQTTTVTDRLTDLLGPQEAAADVVLSTQELHDLVADLLRARAQHARVHPPQERHGPST